MSERIIYIGCPHCDWKVLRSVYIGKWVPDKLVTCGFCESESELSEWVWYEKHLVPFFRELNYEELLNFAV